MCSARLIGGIGKASGFCVGGNIYNKKNPAKTWFHFLENEPQGIDSGAENTVSGPTVRFC